MDDWVIRAMERWPNVPALFGWLELDRRGRWLIQGEPITHPRIVEMMSRNYGCDERGRWFFQNGPQRGYIALRSAPWVLRRNDDGATLVTHTGLPIEKPAAVYMDEEGALLLAHEHGAGELVGGDLDWAMQRLEHKGRHITDEELEDALAAPSGEITNLSLEICGIALPVIRLDFEDAPDHLGFVRDPQPQEGERAASRAPD